MLVGDWLPPSGARYQLHRRYLVPVTEIALDEPLIADLRRWVPTDSEQPVDIALPAEGCQGTLYPVVERDNRLVLVAGFSSFVALREAGAAWMTAYVLEAPDDRDLFELALVIALGGP